MKEDFRRRICAVLTLFIICHIIASYAVSEEIIENREQFSPYDRVIIIGLDGAGTFIRDTDTPNFDRIFAGGNVTWDCEAPYPTISAQGWGSIIYGVSSDVHGLTNAVVNENPFHNPRLTSIFGAVKKKYPDSDVAAITTWHAFGKGIIDQADDIYRYPMTKNIKYKTVISKTEEYIAEHDPRLIFCYFGELDEAGHAYGFGSNKYLEKTREIDQAIGTLYDDFEKQGLLDNTLLMLVTDHGGTAEGTHGGSSPEETQTVFAIRGKGVLQNTEIKDMQLRDIAAITLYALGIDIPETYSGRVPNGIFEGVGGGKHGADYRDADRKKYRNHKTTKTTPELLLSDELIGKLRYRQTFDGETVNGIEGKGKMVSGYFGKALNCKTGWLDTGINWDSSWPGVTLSMWVKVGSLKGDPVFITNKDWSSGDNAGVAAAWLLKYYKINFGTGDKGSAESHFFSKPEDFQKGWSHLLISIDIINSTFSVYKDFLHDGTYPFGEKFTNPEILKTEHSFVIGQDITGRYSSGLNAGVDEVMIFNCALTADDVEELRLYYSQEQPQF